MINYRPKRNSSKINLTISAIFHSVLIAAVFFFAAREGMLGKKLKQLTVTMVPKEKKPEPPKEKPVEPKVQQVKQPEPPRIQAPQPKVETAAAPPPRAAEPAPAAPAPAAVSIPAFEFHDGAKEVATISDPNGVYKALVEHTFLSRWNRPEGIEDEKYAAEAELTIDAKGRIENCRWLTGSGDKRWDESVKAALNSTKMISRVPPKGFPPSFKIRFDVESQRTESIIQVSSR